MRLQRRALWSPVNNTGKTNAPNEFGWKGKKKLKYMSILEICHNSHARMGEKGPEDQYEASAYGDLVSSGGRAKG